MTWVRRKLPGLEGVLLVVFISVTLWILAGSFLLDSEASKLFPQLSGGIVLSLLVLYLLWEFVPDEYKDVLPEKEALTYGDEDESSEEFDENAVAVVFVLFGAYVLGVYLFGFLISTPLYVYGNLRFYDYGTRRRELLIAGLTFVVVSVAYQVFRIPVDQGLVFGFLT